MVDSPRQSPGKRKDGSSQPSPPKKRQTFWVEVPPRPKRRKIPSAPVKLEPSSPDNTIQAIATTPAVKEEPDHEMTNALAVIKNVNRCLNSLLGHHGITDTILTFPFLFSAGEFGERLKSLGRCVRFHKALKDRAGNLPNNHRT
jgi:hypothetical protein